MLGDFESREWAFLPPPPPLPAASNSGPNTRVVPDADPGFNRVVEVACTTDSDVRACASERNSDANAPDGLHPSRPLPLARLVLYERASAARKYLRLLTGEAVRQDGAGGGIRPSIDVRARSVEKFIRAAREIYGGNHTES